MNNSYRDKSVQKGALSDVYTNKDGEAWSLPEGAYPFEVVSAETGAPKFLEGKIDPLDVKPGQVQKMRVVVQDEAGVASVIAEVETDKGTTVIKLAKTGTVSYEELAPERYAVKNGELEILSPFEVYFRHAAKILSEEGILTNFVARAASSEKEVWEGSWVVRDTHTKTYSTTFRAKSVSGKEATLTMAWSDPCFTLTGPFGGDALPLNSPCSVGALSYGTLGAVDGWDGGNITINSNVTFIETVGNFIWNPGRSITIGLGGSFSGLTGSFQLRESCLYFTDSDGDGHTPSGAKTFSDNCTTLPGKVRMMSALSTNDCYDNGAGDASAYPGQTGYFSTPRGDGSYDYNCDGSGNDASGPAPGIGRCDTGFSGVESCNTTEIANNNGVQGFTTAVSCGNSGTYVLDPGGCYSVNDFPLPCITETRSYTCGTPADSLYGGANGSCTTCAGDELGECTAGNSGSSGWVGGSVLACGATGTYIDSPGSCDFSCTVPNPACVTTTRTQTCR